MDEALNGVLNELFLALMAAVVLYLSTLARTYVKRISQATEGQLDEEARKRLERAFDNAIALAEARGQQVQLSQVLNYVRQFNSGDLARHGLRGSALSERGAAAIAARKTQPKEATPDA